MCSCITLPSSECCICAALSHWHPLTTVSMELYHSDILWVLRMCSYITLISFGYCVCAAISHWYPLSTAYVQLYHTDILWVLRLCSYITLISFEYSVCAAISHWYPLSTAYVQLYHTDILWVLHIIHVKKRYINVIFFLAYELTLLVIFLKNQCSFGLNGCVCLINLRCFYVRTTEIKGTGMWVQILCLHFLPTCAHERRGLCKVICILFWWVIRWIQTNANWVLYSSGELNHYISKGESVKDKKF